MKTICFDLDGVVCSATDGAYENAIPDQTIINFVNQLYDEGYRILIFTARYMNRSHHNIIETYRIGYEFTRKQLELWGVKYHELWLGKPVYDLIVDDKAAFYTNNMDAVRRAIQDI